MGVAAHTNTPPRASLAPWVCYYDYWQVTRPKFHSTQHWPANFGAKLASLTRLNMHVRVYILCVCVCTFCVCSCVLCVCAALFVFVIDRQPRVCWPNTSRVSSLHKFPVDFGCLSLLFDLWTCFLLFCGLSAFNTNCRVNHTHSITCKD